MRLMAHLLRLFSKPSEERPMKTKTIASSFDILLMKLVLNSKFNKLKDLRARRAAKADSQ